VGKEFDPLDLKPVTKQATPFIHAIRKRVIELVGKHYKHQTMVAGTGDKFQMTVVIPHHPKTGRHGEIIIYDFIYSRQPVAIINSEGTEITYMYYERDHVVKIHVNETMIAEALRDVYQSVNKVKSH